MQNIIILTIILSAMFAFLIGIFQGKLFIPRGTIFSFTEKKTGWRAIVYGLMLEIIFAVVLFIWINTGNVTLTKMEIIASAILGVIISPFLYMLNTINENQNPNKL